MSEIWFVFLILYSIGWVFESNPRREYALQICFIAYIFNFLLARFPEFNFPNQSAGFAIVEIFGLVILAHLGFRVLSVLFTLSILFHSLSAALYLFKIDFFFYSHIMLIINVIILGILVHDSKGYDFVLRFYRCCVDKLYSYGCDRHMPRPKDCGLFKKDFR